ncbi:MAG: PAS domain S-box protein, partial [Chitinophagaceae bacterium]|nr:PAS domain S-box protein [Chitinophagaceae bacterium]
EGEVYAIIHIAVDVTAQVIARKKLEESEAKLRSVIATAPAGIGLFVGRDLVVELPNQSFIDIVGKGSDIVGKPLREVMPELESQTFLQILDEVYTSGKMFQSFGSQVNIVQQGVMTYNYYNITYTPLFDAEGKVYAILDIAIDVTDSVKARQNLEETQASLRGAIELAELSTWSIDPVKRTISYSERMEEWVGISADALDVKEDIPFIEAEDREAVKLAIGKAMHPDSGGLLEMEYGIRHLKTGRKRIVHAQGRMIFTAEGEPYKMIGTALDVTEQRLLQQNLKQQVVERTKELQEVNDELKDSNRLLIHSNEELAQYAYVASHDLQEPLRKIMMFSSMLTKQEQLPEKSKEVITKISKSTERMSMLINNLLDFSRLLKTDVLKRPIDLLEIATAVIDDFELLIKEKSADIKIGALPTIEAVGLQMNQLFYNLINNALKFSSPDKNPQILITANMLSEEEVKQHIEFPEKFRKYHCISIADNGIGFDSKYADQIFEVFKRLHGRESYPGSGIGLALCRRIVANHHGYLYAESKPGAGSVFCIILPDKQHDFKSTLPEEFTRKNLT